MLAAVPSLRAFGISLCGNVDRADDLVQETLLRALANIESFQPGTNMSAWLFTILRNLFRSEYRKRRREVEDADGSYADTLKTQPEQTSRVEFEEFRVAVRARSEHVQFERTGYFIEDSRDSKPGALVFNRTITLKDTWSAMAKAGTSDG